MCVYKNDTVEYFIEAINSVLNQTLKPEQIIIVRDGPVTIEMQSVLDNYKSVSTGNIKIVELEKNVGLAQALNIGIDYCDCEYIARMDADDVSLDTRFEEQMMIFKSDHSIALVSSWYDQYNESMTTKITDRKVPEKHREIVAFSKTRTPFNHSCAIYKKDAVISVGKYPEITSYCEDWWLALRLMKRGYELANIQRSLVKVRGGNNFFTRRSGIKYLKIEIMNFLQMYNENLIGFYDLVRNIFIRLPIRLLPNKFIERIYTGNIRK